MYRYEAPYILNVVLLQGGLYPYLISKVDGFRSFIGAPETERFNLVLLGGEYHTV